MNSPFDRSLNSTESAADVPLPELLRLVAHRAEEPFQQFYDRTSPQVYGMALAVVANDQRAEQVTAQVYLDVWWRGSEFDASTASVGSWLALLTRARIIEELRRSRTAAHNNPAVGCGPLPTPRVQVGALV